MEPVYTFEEELFALLLGLISSIPAFALSIAAYVLTSVAIYTIAQRRGLRKPWLAWIPVLNLWLIGSLSDQYQYIVNRKNTSRRKILLGLVIAMTGIAVAFLVLFFVVVGGVLDGFQYGRFYGDAPEVVSAAMVLLGLCLPLCGVAVAYAVIRYMAMYDIYKSLDPKNCVLYLVLSICFGVTEPFFLFFNRNKDTGMPPRKPEPVYVQEPVWEENTRDYL